MKQCNIGIKTDIHQGEKQNRKSRNISIHKQLINFGKTVKTIQWEERLKNLFQ